MAYGIDQGQTVNSTTLAFDGGEVTECKDGNNEGLVIDVYCKPTG